MYKSVVDDIHKQQSAWYENHKNLSVREMMLTMSAEAKRTLNQTRSERKGVFR